MAYDIPSISDLEAIQLLNKHYAEVITSKEGGVSSAADITQTTNPITGVTRRTLYKILDDAQAEHDAQISAHEVEHDNQMQSFENDFDSRLAGMAFTRVGTFTAGATLTDMRQTLLWEVSQGGDGHEYGWTGSFLPSGKVVAAGSTPATSGGVGAGSWVDRTDDSLRDELEPRIEASEKNIEDLSAQFFEALRRSYAEAGYNLVDGSFEAGGTVTSVTDVLLYEATGIAYLWLGALPKVVPAGSTPVSTGGVGAGAWVDAAHSNVEERLLGVGAKIYRGSNGAYVQNGDVVPAETTHLRVLLNGKVETAPLLNSSIANNGFSGVVSNLNTTTKPYTAKIGSDVVYLLNLKYWLQPVIGVPVLAFWADPLGIENSTAQINAAFSSAKEGGSIYIGAGTFKVSASSGFALRLTGTKRIFGAGKDITKIKLDSTVGKVVLLSVESNSNAVFIDGLTLDGGAGSLVGVPWNINNKCLRVDNNSGDFDSKLQYLEITNCRIQNSEGEGLYSATGTRKAKVVNCDFENTNGGGGNIGGSTRYVDCNFKDMRFVSIEHASWNYVGYLEVINCVFENGCKNTGSAITALNVLNPFDPTNPTTWPSKISSRDNTRMIVSGCVFRWDPSYILSDAGPNYYYSSIRAYQHDLVKIDNNVFINGGGRSGFGAGPVSISAFNNNVEIVNNSFMRTIDGGKDLFGGPIANIVIADQDDNSRIQSLRISGNTNSTPYQESSESTQIISFESGDKRPARAITIQDNELSIITGIGTGVSGVLGNIAVYASGDFVIEIEYTSTVTGNNSMVVKNGAGVNFGTVFSETSQAAGTYFYQARYKYTNASSDDFIQNISIVGSFSLGTDYTITVKDAIRSI